MKTLMRTTLRVCALAAFALAAPFAWAQGGLAGTSHDFAGLTGAGQASGLCTFCHTPHRNTLQNLLWNRGLSANANYSWTDANTTGGTPYASFPNTYNGTTVKCLSCHDGSVAIGDVSWWNATAAVNFGVVNLGAAFVVGNGGAMQGNHPVAMPYPLNNQPSAYNNVTTGTGVVMEWVANPEANGIRMYNDADGTGTTITAGAVANFSGIECASCHDPHNGSTVQGPFFLRGQLGDGANYICTKCHVK